MEKKSTTQLSQDALSKDEAVRSEAISALHKLGNKEVLDTGLELLESASSFKRAVGVDILAQLGVPDRSFSKETVDVFLKLLSEEKSPEGTHQTGR